MDSEDLLSAEQVGEILNRPAKTILNQYQRWGLPAYRVGGRLRFKRSEIDAWLKSRRVPASES